ncbi:MAG TPA: 3'(2'),5'-bisphosphate nucleotidase [Lacipirellulaceae bacterium]
MFESAEARFAIDAVREAALLARRIQREMVTPAITKDDRSPVTVADFAIQALVAQRLRNARPNAVLIGEERADTLRSPAGAATLEQVTQFISTIIPRIAPHEVCDLIDSGGGDPPASLWTLDPIDGTKGFLRREQYAIALAFIRDGSVELGILGCPELADGGRAEPNGVGSIVAAAAGLGTWTRPLEADGEWRRLTVSDQSKPTNARLLRSVEKAHTNTDEIGQLLVRLGINAPPIAMDSQAKYAVLAAGAGDALVRLLSPSKPDYREKIWDQAAGSIVVTEAGGRITDLDGAPLDFSCGRTLADNRGVLATNGHLHEAVLKALKAIGA